MPIQRMLTAAVMMLLALVLASLFLKSSTQLWILMASVGAATGLIFKTGQRNVISGFSIAVLLTLLREWLMYGQEVVSITALVYVVGYLFAAATTVTIRFLRTRVFVSPTQY